MTLPLRAAALGALLFTFGCAFAQPAPTLKLDPGGGVTALETGQLLHRSDLASVPLAGDAFYGKKARTYRAVPVTWLVDASKVPAGATVQFRATDGFVAAIPATLLLNRDRAKPVAWIAVDDPAQPWPPLPKRGAGSPGPFALIWSGPGAAAV
ncbi:MAG: hypothetical protein Q7T55_19055, partial [Solirubrobacteraceae bacterium]|nr:hypothetical protein [Solirubrobacteraceae bacterium]